MNDELYNIVFDGTILPGQSKEDVKKKLSTLFKIDQQKMESYFSSKPVVVKSNVSKQVCDQYTAAFKKAGAQCIIKPVAAASVSATKPSAESGKPAHLQKPAVPPPAATKAASAPAAKATPAASKTPAKPAAKQSPESGKPAQPQRPAVPVAKVPGSQVVTAKSQAGKVAKPQQLTPQGSAVKQAGLTSQKPEAKATEQPKKPAVQPKPVVPQEPDLLEAEGEQEQDADAVIEMLKKKYQITDQDKQGDTTSKTQQKQPDKSPDLFSAWNEGLDDTSDELDQLFSNLTTTKKDKGSNQPLSGKGMTGTVQFDDVEKLFSGFDTGTKKSKSPSESGSDDIQGDLDDLFSSFSSQKSQGKGNAGSELEDFDKEKHSDESTQFMIPPHLAMGKNAGSSQKVKEAKEEKEEQEEESTQFMFPPNVTAKDNGMRRRDTDGTIEAPPFFDSEDFFGSPQDASGKPSVFKSDEHALSEEDAAFKASTGTGVSGPKTKQTALLLALGTAPLAWLYTYKQDLKKFWINIGLSATGVLAFVSWIWAIIDIARRPEGFYSSIEEDDKLGLIALITGVFGIFGGFVPAIVCGYVHLSRVKKSGGKLPGKQFAMIGLILGIVSTVLFLAGTVVSLIYLPQFISMMLELISMMLGQGGGV